MTSDEVPPRKSRRDWEEEEQHHWEMEEAARKEREAREAEEAADRESAIDTMTEWFHEQFEDPANDTPWDGEDKKYVFMWGGPYEAHDVLHENFDDQFPEDWVNEAVETVEMDGIFEWAPTSHGDYYEHPEHYGPEDETGAVTAVQLIGEISEQLDTIERLLPQLPKAPTGVGHNMPPEEIGLPPYNDETEAELKRQMLIVRGQLEFQDPNREVLRQSESGFRLLAAKIISWVGRKADLVVDETIKAGIKAGIWGTVGWALLETADKLADLLRVLG